MMALLALAMVGLAFASVPLYRIFCQVTGLRRHDRCAPRQAPGAVAGQIGVRFDANIDPALPWQFEPEQSTVRIHPGERTIVNYRATNLHRAADDRARRLQRHAVQAGQYFSKIECFCFTEQTLKPGESVDMPVVFYVDPKLRDDDGDQGTSTRSPSATHFTRWKIRQRPARAPANEHRGTHRMAATKNHDYHSCRPIPGRSSAPSRRWPCSAGW